MTKALQPLILSLKPHYAELIFKGKKKVELRRRIASQISGRDVIIYVSSPVSKLRGGFQIGQVWKDSPDEVWNSTARLAAIARQEFDAYFHGQTIAYALEVTNLWEYQSPIGINWLREQLGNFVVPQSWRYAKSEESEALSYCEKATLSFQYQ